MVLGINATLITLTNGTTANAPDVLTDLQNINNGGISNDGVTTTDGAGTMTVVGLITQILQCNPTAVSVSGQTSGTATLYQLMSGTIKKFVLILNNYKNTANQYITLPTAFTTRAWFNIGDTGAGHVSFYTGGSGGSAVNLQQITTLGSATAQSFAIPYSVGMVTAGFDTIQLQVNSSAANGILTVEGV